MKTQIDVCEELQLTSVDFSHIANNEVRCKCPFHADTTPSCDINTETGVFVCRSCKAKGHIAKLLARITGKGVHLVLSRLRDKYGGAKDKPIEPSLIEEWHQEIWENEHLLAELDKRAVTEDLIRKYRLGVDSGRITIPIGNSEGIYVNVRKYKPGARSYKFINTSKRGVARLYPFDQLHYDRIVVCGGELKAMVAAKQLNPHGVGAISLTAGEGNWDASFNDFFRDKAVFICLDVDKHGRMASASLCAQIYRFAETTHEIVLPIDVEKGDINDFVSSGGDMWDLVSTAVEWKPLAAAQSLTEEARDASLPETVSTGFVHRRFNTRALVAAVDQSTFSVPKSVSVICDKEQPNCGICPIAAMGDDPVVEIDPESPAVLAMMESSDSRIDGELQKGIGIPKCKSVCFKAESFQNATEVRLQTEIDLKDALPDSRIIPAVFVDCDCEVNGTYALTGSTVPHPKSQRLTLSVSKSKAVADAVSGFKLQNPETLLKYQPDSWDLEALESKLDDIYTDLEANVTLIFERRALQQAIDLTYYSPLSLSFDGKDIKGCMDTLVLGDSSVGKSETFLGLQKHYGLGERVDCKNATRAGILGGVEQLAGKHFVTWGIIPRHDGRLVALEELKGMAPEVYSSLTDMRSSGVAEIPKIRHGKALARTRLVAFTNPRSGLPMCSYGFGVDAIRELIPGLEDIRRFDLAVVLDRDDVDAEVLQTYRPQVEHVADSESSRALVLWSWTRPHRSVVYDGDTESLIREASKYLTSKFTDELPILDRGSTRFKITRIASAVAARTFSTCDDYEQLIIRPCHAQWACKYIDTLYSSHTHGYLRYSEHVKKEAQIAEPAEIKRLILGTPNPRQTVDRLLATQRIEPQDIADWCSWDNFESREFISTMVRNNALKRQRRHYLKTAALTAMLVELSNKGELSAPDHLVPEKGTDTL